MHERSHSFSICKKRYVDATFALFTLLQIGFTRVEHSALVDEIL